MARATKAQQIEADNEAQALAFFREALFWLRDPRRRQGTRYPLVSVVVIALMAMVCGADNAQEMELWGETNEDWLQRIVELPHGAPTQDVFLAVFAAIDPEAFERVFLAWMDLLRRGISKEGKHVAIDGKTSRRSFDTKSAKLSIHTVSAWLSDEGLVIGQVQTQEKSNEITAIPELLRTLDLRGATVTIDAMGCQTAIAKDLIDAGAHYLLAVKDNQPALHADVAATFTEAARGGVRSVDERPRPAVEVHTETEKGHGRIETRTAEVCRDLGWMLTAERWPSLACLVKVTRERIMLSTSKSSTETAYYISSDPTLDAKTAAHRIRRHWAVENELHWVLDMAFREDEARHRAGHVAKNFTTLRHFALNLLKRFPDRHGVAGARKQAGWNNDYLLRVLTWQGVS